MRMSEEVKIMFKSSKKRQVRRRESSSDEEVEYNKEEYEKTRELQKLRSIFLILTLKKFFQFFFITRRFENNSEHSIEW